MRLNLPPACIVWLLAVSALVLGSSCPHVCDANSCRDGCCGDDGICWVDNTHSSCGLDGRSCQSCTSAQNCTLGQCVNKCNAGNCPNGCCDEYGSCRTPGDFDCGTGGAACRDCYSSGLRCTRANTCGTCTTYGTDCADSSTCCPQYTCVYSSFYGRYRCE